MMTALPLISKAVLPDEPGNGWDLPNILWITSEDNSPWLGCYGDKIATTPYLDQLARDGFLYTHAFANAPVCAPSRNTIITGVYASSSGNEHMRSNYAKSEKIRLLPEYLKDLGYYCINNAKKDYNFSGGGFEVWDESSKEAHYKNRKKGQPFFAVFNTTITHESCLHRPDTGQVLKHDPDAIRIAPYHPDTRIVRRDYARFYDAIEKMDGWVGAKLEELEQAGLADNTIVIYYGDHGGILGRSKRFLYETGTRIPLIIRIPRKYQYLYPASTPGSSVDRLTSLVDLLPTMLSIVGIQVPGHVQGQAFLGAQKTADPQYVHMFRGRMDERIDRSRAVRGRRYRYIRNDMPYRVYAQHIDYLWKAPSMRSWWEDYRQNRLNEVQSRFFRTKPVEELYDSEKDPWEVNNLATDPAYQQILIRLRRENNRWMEQTRDAGLMPEGVIARISKSMALYDYMRSGAVSIQALIAASDLASFATAQDLQRLERGLTDKNESIRYWAASGLLQLGSAAKASLPALIRALNDTCADVAITAAEALHKLGHTREALPVLFEALRNSENMVKLHALNVMDHMDAADPAIQKAIKVFAADTVASKNIYVTDISRWILTKPTK